ncbi:protein CASC3 isoform X2 [Anabrus simplex]|uniref:protein CASC3 isoform X2 n=1 Tax=Anabrus simplex TaxID=316456 RepID=UPI0035A2947F
MSVDVRRRPVRVSGDCEGLSEDSYEDSDLIKGSEGETDLNVSSECQPESEYETLDEGGEDESVSGDDLTAVDDDREDEDLSDSVIIELEREEGDGQESIPPKEKKLDDDEDRRNPQYIPKRGTFYEHDDRTAAEDTNEDAADKDGERGKDGQNEKKKVWKEHENRWSHDRYNEEEQLPKTKEELVAVYGYDIRNEDAPPRARRRRKYGRGPNKYTRNWEDEDAYGKSSAVILRGTGSNRRRGRGGRRGGSFGSNPHDSEKEFPPLGGVSSNKAEEFEDTNQSSNNSVYASRAAERRQERGGNKSQHRDAFPPLSPLDQTKADLHRNENFSRDDRCSGTGSTNAWRKDNNQNRVEIREDVQRPEQENWRTTFSSNTSSSGSNTTINSSTNISNRNIVQVDERRERAGEESRWKRGGRTFEKPLENDEEEEDSVWYGKNRPIQGKKSGVPLESQTFTSSGVPRGRGRGIRKSTGRQSVDFKSNTSRGQGNRRSGSYRSHSETRVSSHDEGSGSEGGSYPVNNHVINRTTDNITRDMGRVSLNDQQLSNGSKDYPRRASKTQPNYQNSERRQPVVPPRMQENAANKPKRYSSQRQKSLPETGGPSYTQPQGYYAPGYVPQPEELEGVGYVQQPVYAESPQQTTVVQPPTTPPLALIPPHAHAQGPAFAATFPSPPTFIPPPVSGPPPRILPPGATPYLAATPTAAPIINYVPTPTQGQFPPQAYPAFQGYTTVPTPQPPELYQPQGGITYYSPEEQMMARTTIAQKRPSTAIPIVPPPEREPRGRGRIREVSPTEVTPGANSNVVDVGTVEDPQPVTETVQEETPESKVEDSIQDTTPEVNEQEENDTHTQGTDIVNTVVEQEIQA